MSKLNLASLLRDEQAVAKFLEMSKRDVPEGFETLLAADAERIASEALAIIKHRNSNGKEA